MTIQVLMSKTMMLLQFNPDESIAADSTEQGADGKLLECGVCNAIVPVSEWNEHIGREHNYLAWRVGSTPLVSYND